MKKLIKFSLLNLFIISGLQAATLNPYWHMLPEEQGYAQSMDKADANDDLESIDAFLEDYADIHHEVLNEQNHNSADKASGWKMKRVRTWLGLGASGKIGPIGFGGGKLIKLDWEPKKINKSVEKEEEFTADISLNQYSTEADLKNQLEPVIQNLVKSKKVTDEKELRKNLMAKGKEFFEMSKAMDAADEYAWYVKVLRLDFGVGASGKLQNFVVKVGADVRIRLEWARVMNVNKKPADKSDTFMTKTARSAAVLLKSLAQDITAATADKKAKNGFMLDEIRVCLSMSAEGKVVVASVKGSVGPCIHINKKKVAKVDKAALVVKADDTFPMAVDNEENVLNYAKKAGIAFEKGNDGSIFKVNRRKFRRGIDKAWKFGMKFTKKVNKKRYKRSKWGLKKVRPLYSISVSGSVGPAKLKATPDLELIFTNYNM